jgi:hypothetical protein
MHGYYHPSQRHVVEVVSLDFVFDGWVRPTIGWTFVFCLLSLSLSLEVSRLSFLSHLTNNNFNFLRRTLHQASKRRSRLLEDKLSIVAKPKHFVETKNERT